MKCSLRFEKLLAQRKAQGSFENMNDQDILQELVTKYNSFKATAALRRWQITPDQANAMVGVIIGMTMESRSLIRQHLDVNKWDENGFFK